MINLFALSSNDQAVAYLGQIFGYVGSVLPVQNPPLLVGMMFKVLNTTALTIGAILVIYVTVVGLLKTAQEGEFLGRQWNALWVPVRTVLGIAALFPTSTGYSAIQVIIMWIILQGVGAADTLWTKVLQYIQVTGSVYASVGAVSGGTAAIKLQPAMQQLYEGLVCQASAKASYPTIPAASTSRMGDIKYYCNAKNDSRSTSFCNLSDSEMWNIQSTQNPNVSANKYAMGPNGNCGQLVLCSIATECANPNSTSCVGCKAEWQAMQSIVPVLGAVASKFVAIDNQYAQFYAYEKPVPVDANLPPNANASTPVPSPDWVKSYCSDKGISPDKCCVNNDDCTGVFPASAALNSSKYDMGNTSSSNTTPLAASKSASDLYLQYPFGVYLNGSDFVNAAIGQYMSTVIGAVSADIQRRMDQTQLTGWYTTAQSYGWIFAGIFYYKIAGENQKDQEAVINTPNVGTPANVNDPLGDSYRNNYKASIDMLSVMNASNKSSASFTNTPGMSGAVSDAIGGAGAALLKGWTESLTGQGQGRFNTQGQSPNPIIGIASFGYSMMMIAQVLFFVLTATATLMTSLATISPIVLGNGLSMNPVGEGIKAFLNLVSPFFAILISALFSIGALLGLYVPLIPFMIFSLGAIGWLIGTIEAMVAGPIIALGILSPGGQHDILGRAEPALMQIFNLFLRPSLMIIGMMISMLFCTVAIKLVNAGFVAIVQTIAAPGLFEQIMLISIYTSFIVTVVSKVFSLIYVIPERVLTYIGGPAVQYGEEQGLGASKQALEGAASGISGAAGQTSGAARSGAESVGMAREKKKKEDEAKPKEGELKAGDNQPPAGGAGGG